MTFIGIDVSKVRLDVAALATTGEVQREAFDNTDQGHEELVVWLERFPSCRVAVEATGTYHYCLTETLQGRGVYVSVLNPAQVSYSVKSQHRRNELGRRLPSHKTDKADALWLAVYAKERQPAASLVLSLSRQGLAREIGTLSKDITRLKNRLEAAEAGRTHAKVIASLKRRVAALEEEKKKLETELFAGNESYSGARAGAPAEYSGRRGTHRLLTFSRTQRCKALCRCAQIGGVRRFNADSI